MWTRSSGFWRATVHAWLIGYAAIWALTLGCAALVAIAGVPLSVPVHDLLGLRLSANTNPPPDLGRVLALTAHNIPIVSWPLLLGTLGARRHRASRRAADVLVLACSAANVVPVGAALGAYGWCLVPYVPQLPLEWAALGLGASSWLRERGHSMSPRERLPTLATISCILVLAALVEVTATPHR